MCASITSWYLHNCNGRTQSFFSVWEGVQLCFEQRSTATTTEFFKWKMRIKFFVFEFLRHRRKKNWISVWHRFFVYCVFLNFTASFNVCIEIPLQSDSQSSCSWLFCTLVPAPSSVVIKTIFSMSFFPSLFLLIPIFINECNEKWREKNGFASDHSRQNKTNCATNAHEPWIPCAHRALVWSWHYIFPHICALHLCQSHIYIQYTYVRTYALSLFGERASHLWPK